MLRRSAAVLPAAGVRLAPTATPALALLAQRGFASSSTLQRQDDRGPRRVVRPRARRGPAGNPFGPFGADPYTPDPYGGFVQPVRVSVPDDPGGVLSQSHAAHELLAHESLVVVRQLEMLNVFMGYEQANRYAIYSPDGQIVGFMAEEDSILSTMSRNILHTHRPLKSTVLDVHGNPILWIRRPFTFINSRIYVHAAEEKDSRIVGETQQSWHLWRRKYNLFQERPGDVLRQFARIDGGFLAWDFWLKDKDDRLAATINRNFRGLGRELFTDTGQYVIRFDAAGTELDLPPGSEVNVQGQTLILPERSDGGLTLDQRAMALATAVSIDFDYFSRHSGSGGLGFPFILFGGGDSSDARSGGGTPAPADGGAATGAAAGAAAGAASEIPAGMSEDEYIYGRGAGTGAQQSQQGQQAPPQGPPSDAGGQYGQYGDYQPGEYDQPMEDPWAEQQNEGLFGGGGDSDGGSSWGDWGDWGS
ncbi:hypothetical protein Q8F55_008691 [Vanrija albida]|uniref:Phospholipid scramblase n=1 Tax=Vanrija albida TaxID=181172 RepID=A0ABR3PRI3_9TREE